MWYDLRDANDPELDRLAQEFHLHPLHIEDCRHGNQRAKVEEAAGYIFAVMKPVHVDDEGGLEITDFDLFVGRDFLITVQEGNCPHFRAQLDQLHAIEDKSSPDQLFYKILDAGVDAYVPVMDWFNEKIDELEDEVLERPSPSMLQRIFALKRSLIELRRVLSNMRDIPAHLQRSETELIRRELWPFFRDVYDHLSRASDTVEMQRDLLGGTLDIYLSSVANRTNQVMKVLTVLGTIALPSVVISGFYGMNVKGLPWMDSPHAVEIITALMVATTVALLVILKRFEWF